VKSSGVSASDRSIGHAAGTLMAPVTTNPSSPGVSPGRRRRLSWRMSCCGERAALQGVNVKRPGQTTLANVVGDKFVRELTALEYPKSGAIDLLGSVLEAARIEVVRACEGHVHGVVAADRVGSHLWLSLPLGGQELSMASMIKDFAAPGYLP
jgi:hypothetical protein